MDEGRAEDDEGRPIRQLIWQREKQMLPAAPRLTERTVPGYARTGPLSSCTVQSVVCTCHVVECGCDLHASELSPLPPSPGPYPEPSPPSRVRTHISDRLAFLRARARASSSPPPQWAVKGLCCAPPPRAPPPPCTPVICPVTVPPRSLWTPLRSAAGRGGPGPGRGR